MEVDELALRVGIAGLDARDGFLSFAFGAGGDEVFGIMQVEDIRQLFADA